MHVVWIGLSLPYSVCYSHAVRLLPKTTDALSCMPLSIGPRTIMLLWELLLTCAS